MAKRHPNIFQRFEEKFERGADDECWPWKGAISRHGYGRITMGWGAAKRSVDAHRAAWLIYRGPIPEKLFVLHHCDNRPCVNLAHLYLGTHDDNMADKVSRNRQARGEGNTQHKLTEAQVLHIRNHLLDDPRRTLADIAWEYGLNPVTIYAIKYRRTWRHI